MSTGNQTILVLGATVRQGGAAARALFARVRCQGAHARSR